MKFVLSTVGLNHTLAKLLNELKEILVTGDVAGHKHESRALPSYANRFNVYAVDEQF
jgi:hypothetical protein